MSKVLLIPSDDAESVHIYLSSTDIGKGSFQLDHRKS